MSNFINVLDKGYVRLIDTMGSDLSIVNAARVSYDKESLTFSEPDKRLLSFLVREEHMSPFRHAALTFEVYAPLLVARQWWKYAVGSTHADDQNGWNESSRRYITEKEEFYIPQPGQWRGKPANSKQGSAELPADVNENLYTYGLEAHIASGVAQYQQAMADGIAPEQARLFLPAYSMYVRWRWTTSLAAALHFLQQRLAHDSQFEIQQYARAVADFVEKQFPESYKIIMENNSV